MPFLLMHYSVTVACAELAAFHLQKGKDPFVLCHPRSCRLYSLGKFIEHFAS